MSESNPATKTTEGLSNFDIEGFEELQVFKDLDKEATESNRDYAVITRGSGEYEVNDMHSGKQTSPGLSVPDKFIKTITLPPLLDAAGGTDYDRIGQRNRIVTEMLRGAAHLFKVN